jgi:hypothetical protein
MNRVITNPFFVYIISFSVVLVVYLFGWSTLYPQISPTLLLFLMIGFVFSMVAGVVLHALKRVGYKEIDTNDSTGLVIFLIWLSYCLEFAYNRGVPLLLVMGQSDYDYTQFGIPTFHVFLATFSSFYSVYVFHQLISQRSRRLTFYFLLSIIPGVLIVNRGMVLIILTGCLFVYLSAMSRLRGRIVAFLLIMILVVFYFFGVIGNIRQTNGRTSSSEYILDVGKATDAFKSSVIPKPYFWSYLYISSPLANLQHTMNNSRADVSWTQFTTFELLPDFISKRIAKILNIQRSAGEKIVPWLTVSTFYAHAFATVGWPGMIIMFLFFAGTTVTYLILLRKNSDYYVTGLALMNTLVLFNTFDNMYAFTGMSLQLVYPLLMAFVKFPRIRIGIRSTQL